MLGIYKNKSLKIHNTQFRVSQLFPHKSPIFSYVFFFWKSYVGKELLTFNFCSTEIFILITKHLSTKQFFRPSKDFFGMANLTKPLTFENMNLNRKKMSIVTGCFLNIWLRHCSIEVRVYALKIRFKITSRCSLYSRRCNTLTLTSSYGVVLVKPRLWYFS